MSNKHYLHEPIYFMPTAIAGHRIRCWKSSPDPAPAPDYAAAANQTAQGNLELAQYTTKANRANQTNPWGSLTWTQAPGKVDQSGYDAALSKYNSDLAAYNNRVNNPSPVFGGGWMDENGQWNAGNSSYNDPGTAPTKPTIDQFTSPSNEWTQTVTLDPRLQAALDSQIAVQGGRSSAANTLLGRVQDQIATPIDLSGVQDLRNAADFTAGNGQYQTAPTYDPSQAKQFAQAAFNAQSDMLQPMYDRKQQQLENANALKGLASDSEAARNDLDEFNRSKSAAFNQLANQSLLTGQQVAQGNYQTALQGYQQNNAAAAAQNQDARNNYATGLSGINQNNLTQQSQIQELMARYNTPLNQLNSLLTGQQVAQPTFGSYAAQGQTAGADMMGALQNQTAYNQNAYNAASASAAQGNAATGQAIGSAAMLAMMY